MTINQATLIRTYEPDDIEPMFAIECRCFPDPWTKSYFRRYLRHLDVLTFVAERSGLLVGYCMVRIERDCLELSNLAIAPQFQRLGIGTSLLDTAKTDLTPHRRQIILSVRTSNVGAADFFRANGFRAAKLLRHFWGTSEDAWRMEYSDPPGTRYLRQLGNE